MNTPKKILVVDDSEIDRTLVSRILERASFQVVATEDGTKALDLIETEKPDLVLLDIVMPGILGNEILHHIRQKYSSIELPVIMITAKNEAANIVESLYLGANDYVTKPVDFEVALMRVRNHLRTAELSKEMSRLSEWAAMSALIATYNHEINNPLAIAIGSLKSLTDSHPQDPGLKRIETALWRIADIVKEIKNISENSNVEFEKYAEAARMVKIRRDA